MPKASPPIIGLMMYRDQGWSRSLLPGITRYARESTEWELRLLSVNASPNDLNSCDGVIGPIYGDPKNIPYQTIRSRKIPTINISGALPPPEIPVVTHDNVLVGRMAAEHLLSLGLETFACLILQGTQVSPLRVEGFRGAIQEAGCPTPLLIDLPHERKKEEVLGKLPTPIGIFAINDLRARHLEFHLRRYPHLQIPRDIALLGCDNDFMHCELCATPISSVDLNLEEVGFQAARQLHHLLQGKSAEPRTLIPPKGIARRRSSDYLLQEDTMVRRVLKELRARFNEKLSPTELARNQGLTPRHVQRRFKDATGKTLQQTLLEIRLEQARKLLRETPLTIAEVAMETGFSDINRFPAYFRKRYGDTPRVFRRKCLEEKRSPHVNGPTPIGKR